MSQRGTRHSVPLENGTKRAPKHVICVFSLSGVVEVYRVTRRVELGIKATAVCSEKLQQLLKDISRVWNNLMGFMSLAKLAVRCSKKFKYARVQDTLNIEIYVHSCFYCLLLSARHVYTLQVQVHKSTL